MPIDARRTWTATFDSYDQRTDGVYYVVLLHEDGAEAAEFTGNAASGFGPASA